MEAQVLKHCEGVKSKIPDIEKALEIVEFTQKKSGNELDVEFMVSNNIFAKGLVPVGETVCLWLGAGVMCEYSFEDATALLSKNLENASVTLRQNESDLDFIKDQVTTCEVSKFF